jgi:hypothetical protein
MNEALRRRVSRAEAEEEQEAAVREALVDELRAMELRLEHEKEEAATKITEAAEARRSLGNELVAKEGQAAELELRTKELEAENESRDRQLDELRGRLDQLSEAQDRATEAESQLSALQGTITSQQQEHRRDRYVFRLSLIGLAFVIVAVGAVFGLIALGWPIGLAVGASTIGALSLWLMVADRLADSELRHMPLVRLAHAGRYWIAAPCAAIFLSALGSLLYSVAKG